MKIEIKKKTQFQCEYIIIRKDNSTEIITLETKTYLLHGICHFVVEMNLQYSKGFWGMLFLRHTFNELFGKDNPQTTKLRFIEQIIGPVQSVYWGHIPIENFEEYTTYLDFNLLENILIICLDEINSIMENWQQLPIGGHLMLEWKI